MTRKSLVTVFLSIACMAFLMDCAAASDFKWKTYSNARFGYSLEYPTVLVPQPEATNCDGRQFISPDKKKNLRAFGSFNALLLTVDQLYRKTLDEYNAEGAVVTYKMHSDKSFVISGYNAGKVFYRKTVRRSIDKESQIDATIIFTYPSSEKPVFDKATERISKSLKF